MPAPDNQHSGFITSSSADSVFLGVLDFCKSDSMVIQHQQNNPVALNIYFQKNLCADYAQFLSREMSMYYHRLGKCNAVKTWFRGTPLDTLTSGELTEIAFLTANYFHMDENHYSEYGFECRVEDINEDNLSLIKGLRFTTLLLNIDISMDPDNTAIAKALKLISHYKFREIHFRLHTLKSNETTLRRWLDRLIKYHPVLIEMSGIEKERSDIIRLDQITETMEKRHYTLFGDRFFIIKNHPLVQLRDQGKLQYMPPWGVAHSAIKAWFGLGIGTVGKIGQTLYQNKQKEPDYINDLSLGKLPVCCTGQFHDEHAHTLWVIIEQLLCFHHIDLQQTFPSIARDKITATLEQISQYGWMSHHGAVFTLTKQGINHISEICQALQQD